MQVPKRMVRFGRTKQLVQQEKESTSKVPSPKVTPENGNDQDNIPRITSDPSFSTPLNTQRNHSSSIDEILLSVTSPKFLDSISQSRKRTTSLESSKNASLTFSSLSGSEFGVSGPLNSDVHSVNSQSPIIPINRSNVRDNILVRKKKQSIVGSLVTGGPTGHTVTSSQTDINIYANGESDKVCKVCGDEMKMDGDDDDDGYHPCDCAIQMCPTCIDHAKKFEKNQCPSCHSVLRDREQWLVIRALMDENDDDVKNSKSVQKDKSMADKSNEKENKLQITTTPNADTSISISPDYGYGSVTWQSPPQQTPNREIPKSDLSKRSLFRVYGFSGAKIGPYRIFVFLRACAIAGFLHYRLTNPTETGYWLWLMSVICETWFAVSWILDTIPKLTPVLRETYCDRLKEIYDIGGEKLPQVDVFITTADAQKEPPLITACTILSVLASDYPPEKLAVYLSDDGASKLMFDAMAETAGFARLWVPFCKKYEIEPRSPDAYFTLKVDYLQGKIQTDFVKMRRKVKREFEEFKVRINALVAQSYHPPAKGWTMPDGEPWPGNHRRNHDGIIQVFLHPDGDVRDVDGNVLPPLVYVSREKRPTHEHNKKAGAMNALVRVSGLMTNGTFMLNLDCDHYINNCQAIREALCFFLDPIKGYNVGFVQFPQRFDGIDKNDRYANHNTVFFDINMKGLDGQQGPVYVGTGCVFRRKGLYGYSPSRPSKPKNEKKKNKFSFFHTLFCCCCNLFSRKRNSRSSSLSSQDSETSNGESRTILLPPARMGLCQEFIRSVIGESPLEGEVRSNPPSLLSDVILAISCDYEENTDWGREIGWMYGSVTEDILTGMKIHSKGWISAYCDTQRAAFKGSAPLNLTDRLHQVERWATGAVEIFFSSRNPMWSLWGTKLYFRQRIAYSNNAFYPFTSVAIFTYCILPPLSLLTDYFFVPTLDRVAVIWFSALILTFLVASLLEIRWSGVSFDAWWRNEQFWVIAGVSSHFAAVVQGILKVIVGLEISFTLTGSKGGSEDEDYDELHTFKFTWLLLPGSFLGLMNILGIIIGVGRALSTSSDNSPQWGKLIGKLAFSFWVLIHLYPFAKGMLGRRNRLPTIIIVWALLLVITVSLVWTNFVGGSSFI